MEYYSLNNYLKDYFGGKVYKIAIDAGFSCPNRDGRAGTGGCIFCSGSGSGDFAGNRGNGITEQIESGKALVAAKMKGQEGKYIAYFQAFTNTYAPVEVLKERYMEAISHKDIVALSIATRPDCLGEDVIKLIDEINKIKPVWVELGLQTIHEDTALLINRGYSLEVYVDAVKRLMKTGVHIVTHVILGLPGENRARMLETVRFVSNLNTKLIEEACDSNDTKGSAGNVLTERVNEDHHRFGIKLQLLHVIQNTKLSEMYNHNEFETLTMDEYVNLVADCLEIIPNGVVIHRMTGDGDKRTLVAPLWSGNKKCVLNALNKEIKAR